MSGLVGSGGKYLSCYVKIFYHSCQVKALRLLTDCVCSVNRTWWAKVYIFFTNMFRLKHDIFVSVSLASQTHIFTPKTREKKQHYCISFMVRRAEITGDDFKGLTRWCKPGPLAGWAGTPLPPSCSSPALDEGSRTQRKSQTGHWWFGSSSFLINWPRDRRVLSCHLNNI